MFKKLRWVFRFIRSRTYILVLDKQSVIDIPVLQLESFEDQFLINAQIASLNEFRNRLEDLIGEYKEQAELLAHQERNRQKEAKQMARRRTSRRTTTTK